MSDKIRISIATVNSINVFRQAAEEEKLTDGLQVKVTPAQKEAIRRICAENGLDMSAFAREAVTGFIDLFPYRDKIHRHHRLLRQLLHNLA